MALSACPRRGNIRIRVAAGTAPATEGRRVKRRRGRRALANFENLLVTTQVYELSGKERACPCCGGERQEIGAEESEGKVSRYLFS